jgi:hypothetical protein
MLACGARSELAVGSRRDVDAGVEAGVDADADADAGLDVTDAFDAPEEPPPPVDCVEAGLTYIYVVTAQNELFSFNPPAAQFNSIGILDCQGSQGTPFSMAVDRLGHAYVVFTPTGDLYKVSTATAKCEPTNFQTGQAGFTTFGMGFSTDMGGPSETLFVAESNLMTPTLGLASIDTTTLNLNFIGQFSEPLGDGVELTGTGDNRLFGFFLDKTQMPNQTAIAEIDKKTAQILSKNSIALPQGINDFAFAFWGGDFYLFHAEGAGSTTVTRYNPIDKSLTDIATLPTGVVGVGVSTCAPQ